MDLVQEKVSQAIEILQKTQIDAWITFVRETSAGGDPVLPLIYGHDLTWQSLLILSRNGDRYAIVGHFEADTAKRTGAYNHIIPYHESIKEPLLNALERIKPNKIAVNFSESDVLADGLGHGLYNLLMNYLAGTEWSDRLISAEKIIRNLRGCKSQEEIIRIKAAIRTTQKIYSQTFDHVKPGMTELEVSDFMHTMIVKLGLEPAWEFEHCPTVNSGPDSPVGHIGPTDLEIREGTILHLDFGIKQGGFCSDIQRVIYFLAPGELSVPTAVQKAFDTVAGAIQKAVAFIKPGMTGQEVDKITREIVTSSGYPEYKYATGHQLGRLAHDGAGILGPAWDRYGETPFYTIQAGNVFTIEPGVAVPGYGYVGLEEDILVTEEGASFLSTPQVELIVK